MSSEAADNLTVETADHAGEIGMRDAQLLQRWIGGQPEAFEQLMRRHQHLVEGVCRRILRDTHAVDDAFQATFLVLARRAKSLLSHPSLSGWLHQTARRTALHLRSSNRRRASEQVLEESAIISREAAPESRLSIAELGAVLDEELDRLKPQWRELFLLTQVEQLERAEAAERLGLTPAQVKDGLERAREQLKSRLLRRGITLTAGTLAVWLGSSATSASAGTATLISGTTHTAAAFAAGSMTAAGASAQAVTVAQGVLGMMTIQKLKSAVLVVLSFLGVSGIAWGLLRDEPHRFEHGLRGTLAEVRLNASPPELTIHLDEYDLPLSLDVAADAEVWLAYEARTFRDVRPGQYVSLRLSNDHRTVQEIHVRGDHRQFAIRSLSSDGKLEVVEMDDDEPLSDPQTLQLADDAILRLGGLSAAREEFQPGMTVPMELSADGQTVNAIESDVEQEQMIFGTLQSVAVDGKSIIVQFEDDDDVMHDRTLSADNAAIVNLDGQRTTLDRLPVNATIHLRLNADGEIQAMNATSPVREEEEEE